MTPLYRGDSYALAYLLFEMTMIFFLIWCPGFIQFNLMYFLFTPDGVFRLSAVRYDTSKVLRSYQTPYSRLKRDSHKRVIFIRSPSFFCQRDYSRRAGISKQQAFGTSYCWQIPSRRLYSKQAEERRDMFPQWFSFWYDIWPSFWYDRKKIWPSFW